MFCTDNLIIKPFIAFYMFEITRFLMSEIASIPVYNILFWPFFVEFDTFSSNFLGPKSLRGPYCFLKLWKCSILPTGTLINLYINIKHCSKLAVELAISNTWMRIHISLYGSESRTAKSMQINADPCAAHPDPQHWFKHLHLLRHKVSVSYSYSTNGRPSRPLNTGWSKETWQCWGSRMRRWRGAGSSPRCPPCWRQHRAPPGTPPSPGCRRCKPRGEKGSHCIVPHIQ
jgi:hypothetical protein